MSNVDMAFPVNRSHESLRDADGDEARGPDGERDGVGATAWWRATVVHADMRGLGTSRQGCVAGLPSV